MKNIRLRFAPSPTGFMHIGNLKTVLLDYIIAKKLNGDLLLRIEDTDQKREVEGATQKLIEILNWIGIKFDEGPHIGGDFGPYIQSERQKIYDQYMQELLDKGHAYKCFCSEERLSKLREIQQNQKLAPKYDRACRDLDDDQIAQLIADGEKYVIRQKMPLAGEIIVFDELRGEIKFKAEDLEDQVLVKSNGIPTYHFASVVDDHLMQISHIVRGDEWLPSYPKNILLYKSFGWEAPKFIHAPLILNKKGGKLSKRDGDVTVEAYRDNGYLPEALINFLVLLGWHPADEKEILSIDEIIEKFDYKDMGISGGIFDFEKLDFFNGYYIRLKSLDELTDLCLPYLVRAKFIAENQKSKVKMQNENVNFKNLFTGKEISLEFIQKVVGLEQERLKKLSEISDLTRFFFVENLEYDKMLLTWKELSFSEIKENLELMFKQIESVEEENWNLDFIQNKIITHIKEIDGKNGDYLWPLRVALTGEKASPSPFEVADALGKEVCKDRIKKAIEKLS